MCVVTWQYFVILLVVLMFYFYGFRHSLTTLYRISSVLFAANIVK